MTTPAPALGPIQTQWIAALRSGSYAQGKTHLSSPSGFCCLGVACEIFQQDLNLKVEAEVGSPTRFDDNISCAPRAIVNHLGLFGDLGEAGAGSSLAHLNDDGETFTRIADIISANPDLYFKEPR